MDEGKPSEQARASRGLLPPSSSLAMEKQQLPLPSISSPPAKRSYSPLSFLLVLASFAAISWQVAQFALELPLHHCSGSSASKGLDWTACDDGLLCSRFPVPLDWSNSTDDRTISLSVLKWSGSNQKDKLGSLYM